MAQFGGTAPGVVPALFEQTLTPEVMRISNVIVENAAHSKIVLQKD